MEYSINKLNKNISKYYKSSYIDLVPDLDIVPRVELSGGTQFRILCEKGILECHQVYRTLCMIGIMCHDEHLTGDLCHGMFYDWEYKVDFKDVFDK